MRIAMVISSYHPIVGGAERQVAQLARLMRASGHEVTVVTRHHRGLSRLESVDGIAVHRVAASGPKALRALRFTLGAASALRRIRPDVIHCHSLFTPTLAGLLAARLTGAPVLAKPMCAGEARDIAAKPLGRLRMALARRGLDALVAITGEIRQELVDLGFAADRIHGIANGVDLARFEPARSVEERRRARLALGLPEAGYLLAYAGRMAAQKRLPLLLAAFHDLAARHPELHLALAGANRAAGQEASVGGEDETGIDPAMLAHPRLHALGPVADMPGFLRAADAFVLPSAREGMSNALLEASAAGLPTVSARIGGNAEIVVEGVSGLMFAPDDRADLARAIERLVADPGLGHRLGAAGRARMEAGFSLPVTASRLLALYRRLGEAKR